MLRANTFIARAIALLSATACASAPAAKPAPYQVATVSAPPALPSAPLTPVSQQSNPNGPPTMAPGQPSIVGMPSARLNISARNEDVSSVIGRMARQVGLTAIIDPSVRGTVSRSMQNVTLNEAMQSLVGNQYQYQVKNGALLVSPVQLIQHTYTVDYVAMSRISSGATIVSRGTQSSNPISSGPLLAGGVASNGGLSANGGLAATGTDIIQSSSQADVWGELTQQLESILFGGSADTAGTATMSAGGPRPFTRCAGEACLRISPLTS